MAFGMVTAVTYSLAMNIQREKQSVGLITALAYRYTIHYAIRN